MHKRLFYENFVKENAYGKKQKALKLLLIFLCMIFLALRTKNLFCEKNSKNVSDYGVAATVLYPIEEKLLPDIFRFSVGVGFTCTGLAYDSREDVFWIGNFGKEFPGQSDSYPTIVKVSKDFSEVLDEIEIGEITGKNEDINLQGVSYDMNTDSLWYTDGKKIINISKKGELICELGLGKYDSCIPNGVVYDPSDDSLWVLCYYDYLINLSRDGNIMGVFDCDFKDQDQLCIDDDGNILFSVGADYSGDENYICTFYKDSKNIEVTFRLTKSHAIEGICSIDNNLYVVNDGLFHSAKSQSNTVCIYEIGK